MKVKVKATDNFKSEAKALFKKHRSLIADLEIMEKQLRDNPQMGTSLGNNAFKIRLKITSKGKGKSGGARVITYVETDLIVDVEYNEAETVVNLLSIYDKGDMDTISDKELKRLIDNIKKA
jgi:mRNA-degrading endonuclease RelE of RelBE toxin-antitoxin system